MADLMVQLKYESKVRDVILATLRVTFPFWGVVAPIASTICFIIMLAMFRNATYVETDAFWKLFGAIIGGLLLGLSGLMLTRTLSHESIVADKNGLFLPFTWYLRRRYWPWQTIKEVRAIPAVSQSVEKQSLVLITDRGANIRFNLSRLGKQQIEQLLLALEMWAPTCGKDASIQTLKENLKKDAAGTTDLSFTNMWEEELRRRFCAAAFMPLEPGVHLRNGSLKVIRQLALGGLSALYLCQLDNKRLVVLKEAVVPEDAVASMRDKANEMFQREAKLLMKLDHKGIVKVLDSFVDNGRNYMMLDYINGQDLRQFVQQNGPQKDHVVIEWAVQVCNILKYLHEQDPPIIHRDLSPDNLVLRDDGTVVLIDFGAANEFIGQATGTFVGKQAFIAPEQFRGKPVVQSDIYALGCTIYYLLTGKEPEALMSSSPKEADPNINPELDELVVCCTQMQATDRFQSAAQLLPVLRKLAASLLVT
jgi:predicted Ser/Thr protein kinase